MLGNGAVECVNNSRGIIGKTGGADPGARV